MITPVFGTGSRLVLPSGFRETPQSIVDDQRRRLRNPKISSLSQRPWVAKFLWRHPVLHGSFLELRSCFHRIRSLRERGHIRPAEIGSACQRTPDGLRLVPNKRSLARNRGIQQLCSEHPCLTTEDFRLYLAGWDAAEEWHNLSGRGTEENSGYIRETSNAILSRAEQFSNAPNVVG